MTRPCPTALAALALPLLAACGGTSGTDDTLPPGGTFGLIVDPFASSEPWPLNRPILLRFDRDVRFSTAGAVRLVEAGTGASVPGSIEPGLDPTTGEADDSVVRFQPSCPTSSDGSGGGLTAGTSYRLFVHGEDTPQFFPLTARDGTRLASTWEGTFTTPTPPDALLEDPNPFPPRLAFRRRGGVAPLDLESTHLDLGLDPTMPRRVYLRDSGFGVLEVDPASQSFVPNGLPLNHYVSEDNRVRAMLYFDQQVDPEPENLARIHLEYFEGSWRRIPSRAELVAGCGRRGSLVRVDPIGSLPAGGGLRLRLDAGFADITGQAHSAPVIEYLPVNGSQLQDVEGARVDAIIEHFTVGGDAFGSMEDTTSILDGPRAFWGSGYVAGIEAPGGLSFARSRWLPVGLAGRSPGASPAQPPFHFDGTDEFGRVQAIGGVVPLGSPTLGPLAPSAIGPYHVDLSVPSLADPAGLYAAQPALLIGDRLRLTQTSAAEGPIFGARQVGADVRARMGIGCYAPGYNLDCVPWDLGATFPNGTVEVWTRPFDVYWTILRDQMYFDHGITIRFDATFADASGEPDESAAFSVSSGWTPDVDQLSGAPWDFLRFEIEFDLDLSDDGYDPVERSPSVDFLKVLVDLR